MKALDLAKLLATLGILLVFLAVVLKFNGAYCYIGFTSVRLVSILVLANSCFLLAILYELLFKK